MSFSDYINAVAEHLVLYGRKDLIPNFNEASWARNAGISPRKYAEFLVRRNGSS